MSLNHIIASWRDEEYRESLDGETRSLLPESPAGEIMLTDAELADLDGGQIPISYSWTAKTITFTVSITFD